MKEQKSLNEKQRALVGSVIHFTEATVKNICRGKFSYIIDDIIQDAHLTACKAALLFDPSMGMQFETYLYPFLLYSVRETAQRFGHTISYPHRHKIAESFIHLMMQCDEDGNCIDDEVLSGRSEELAAESERKSQEDALVENLLGRLSKQEQRIVRLYFGFDTYPMKFSQVAKECHLTHTHLVQIFNEALMKMESESLT